MPINLSEYTKRRREYLKAVGACCVYVIGERESGPLKIGIAADIRHRFHVLKSNTLAELNVFNVLWTPGRPVAKRAEQYAHSLLIRANRHLKGEWFNVDVKSAWTTVHWAARELFPNASLFTHGEMMRVLVKKFPERPQGEQKPLDDLQQISDFLPLSKTVGIVPSSFSGQSPDEIIPVKDILADEMERHLDPEGYDARLKAALKVARG